MELIVVAIVLYFLFTFHYVSILIQLAPQTPYDANSLYIPLCLYFNVGGIGRHARFKLLYIPLCLYFNLVKFKIINIQFFLYIPLCLYFNKNFFCYFSN